MGYKVIGCVIIIIIIVNSFYASARRYPSLVTKSALPNPSKVVALRVNAELATLSERRIVCHLLAAYSTQFVTCNKGQEIENGSDLHTTIMNVYAKKLVTSFMSHKFRKDLPVDRALQERLPKECSVYQYSIKVPCADQERDCLVTAYFNEQKKCYEKKYCITGVGPVDVGCLVSSEGIGPGVLISMAKHAQAQNKDNDRKESSLAQILSSYFSFPAQKSRINNHKEES